MLAKVLLAQRELESGRVLLEEIVAQHDLDPDVHMDLGILYSILTRNDDAKTHLGRALELEPTNARAMFNLAGIEARSGDLDAAIGRLEALIAMAPTYPRAGDFLTEFRRLRDEAASEDEDGGEGTEQGG